MKLNPSSKYKPIFILALILMLCNFHNCKSSMPLHVYTTETLEIKRLAKHTYLHTSFLETENWGKVGCNGIVVIDNKEAIIIDTPTNDIVSGQLIQWVENDLKAKVVGVIATHFHTDCLGGLEEFHARGIPSYGNNKTILLADEQFAIMPKNGFDKMQKIKVGNSILHNEFMGAGHTEDNIVCYFEKDKVLFGGCLIKSIGAGKGNLNDANETQWSETVRHVKKKYRLAKIVVPGHGKVGGKDLLDYTIEKFENQEEE